MKSNLIRLLIFCCIIQSCRTSNPTPNNLENITKDFSIDRPKIRFDGIYNTYDTSLTPYGKKNSDLYVTNKFIVFLKNNKIYRCIGGAHDSVAFQSDFYHGLDSSHLGSFKINNDSIFAYIPSLFYNRWGQASFYNANYSGYIKNQDTIINWKMIPQYPDVNPNIPNNNFIYESTPRMLYFIKNDAVRCLDSIAGQ